MYERAWAGVASAVCIYRVCYFPSEGGGAGMSDRGWIFSTRSVGA